MKSDLQIDDVFVMQRRKHEHIQIVQNSQDKL